MSVNSPTVKPSLFGNRVVQAIMMSTMFLQIGIWVRNIAILLYVKEMTDGDAFAVSLISVAEYAPIFVFSFIGGTFADRWRAKRTMVSCDLLSAASIFAILLAMAYGSWRVVFFATLASAILSQFSQPAGLKLFKQHVPEELVQKGMSMYQTLFAVFMIFGPVVGMFVYQRYGIETSIAIMGVAFLLSAGSLAFLPRDRRAEGDRQQTRVMEEMKAGFRYIRSSLILRKLGGGFFAVGLGFGLISPLGIFLITERLGRPEQDLQWFSLANGVAMLFGGLLTMSIASRISPQKLLMISMAVIGLEIIAMGLSTNYAFTMGLQFLNGLLFPSINIGISTLMMKNTEPEYIGRVNGILTPLFTGSMVVTMMLSGLLKNAFSLVAVFALAGICILAGAAVLLPLLKLKSSVLPEQAVSQEY